MTDRIHVPQLSSITFDRGRAYHVGEVGRYIGEKYRNAGYTGKGVYIALVDSGVGTEDACGHGSAMRSAILSVAPQATVVSHKVLDENGDGDMHKLEAVLEDLLEKNYQIINLSLGRDEDCGGLCLSCNTIERLAAKGVHVFAAIGNNADTNNTPNCPAVSLGAMSVGGERIDGDPTSFTVRGWSLNGRMHPMIQAPSGDGVLSQDEWIIVDVPLDSVMDREFPQLARGKAATHGSSIGTAFISGLAALQVEAGVNPREFHGLPPASSHPSQLAVVIGRASIAVRGLFDEIGRQVNKVGEDVGHQLHDQLESLW